MEEKNWLKDLVNSSDFEYFDGEEDEDYEDYEDYEDDDDYEDATGRRRRRMRKVRRANIKIPLGRGNKSVPLQASPNPFTIQESYNAISTLNFDLLVEATKTGTNALPQLEIPILYPYMAYSTGNSYSNWLQRYGITTKGFDISLSPAPTPLCQIYYKEDLVIKISGMSFNITDLYNAILHRNIKLQINKMRFALQEPDDVAYLDALTMYSIGITSKVQKDSLNAGSFVKPQNFNTNIVDVDMKIIVDYNSILTYNYNPAMISADPDTGNGKNTFRMSFFCDILK